MNQAKDIAGIKILGLCMLLNTMSEMVKQTLSKEAWGSEAGKIGDLHYSPSLYGMLKEHIANIVSSGYCSQEYVIFICLSLIIFFLKSLQGIVQFLHCILS